MRIPNADRAVIAPENPGGRVVSFLSVWQIDAGTDCPRLITMYPE
jgi:hypothetical protein